MSSLKPEEIAGILAVIGIAILGLIVKNQSKIDNISYFFHSLLPSSQNWKIYVIIALPLILFINYKINSWIKGRINKSEEERELVRYSSEDIKRLFEIDLEKMYSLSKVTDFINDLKGMLKYVRKYAMLKHYSSRLKEKIKESKIRLNKLVESEKEDMLRDRVHELEDEIRILDENKRRKEFEEGQADDKRLNALHVNDNPVFVKSNLSEKQIDLLLNNGYSYLNEFCVNHGKIIQVLVKPTLNHSKTHTFLVWSVKRYLNKLKEVSHVQDFDTVGADITFKSNGEKFAIEIETGSLLSKKFQLSQKVDSLNEKYKDGWMFIVSNKNLLPKYRKFGVVTSRSEFPKTLKKLLKTATQ